MSSSYRKLDRLTWWHTATYNIAMKKTGRIVKCEWCGSEVYKKASHLLRYSHYFCSQACRVKNLNHNKVPWNKGTVGVMQPNAGSFKPGQRHSIDTEFKPREHAFTGTPSEYKNIHYRVGVILGKPRRCEDCGRDGLVGRQIHWANITGTYNTDKENWKRLCAKCHAVFDDRISYGK